MRTNFWWNIRLIYKCQCSSSKSQTSLKNPFSVKNRFAKVDLKERCFINFLMSCRRTQLSLMLICHKKEVTWKGILLFWPNIRRAKHSFLRELREVAPEMELFPENHSPYEKDFVTKSNPYAKFSARHFTKKFVSWRICQESGSPHFFDGNSLPNTTLEFACARMINGHRR